MTLFTAWFGGIGAPQYDTAGGWIDKLFRPRPASTCISHVDWWLRKVFAGSIESWLQYAGPSPFVGIALCDPHIQCALYSVLRTPYYDADSDVDTDTRKEAFPPLGKQKLRSCPFFFHFFFFFGPFFSLLLWFPQSMHKQGV